MDNDRDVLVTLRVKVEALEKLFSGMDGRIGKVEDRLDEKYDAVITEIKEVRSDIQKHRIAFWKYLSTFLLSSGATALIEYLVTHH